ncbi:barstar family protein [Streptomyces sp. TRM S81-3]|uniref:Barstar family protein n=1 Tax=Streptomyces griseicoloratus TaxID=2752516 RepID=A0A926L7E2_9ACTN|nr:Scr1 family TA system antitoxin-like transcriptional regulator [Streptomyces griseicoloratus]MBD0422941.1 barstar family protein [Streptomyces griseicoloratus]
MPHLITLSRDTPISTVHALLPSGLFYSARMSGRDMPDADGVFAQFYEHLRLPDYFGWNWDAPRDCLQDFHWLPATHVLVAIDDAAYILPEIDAFPTEYYLTQRNTGTERPTFQGRRKSRFRPVFKAALPPLPEHEVALRLAHRLERQRVLEGDSPTEYVGVLHEAALRMQFGGRKVARGQLEHLLAFSELPHVSLRVLPFAAGAFPGAGQTVVYMEGPVRRLDTVQIDSSHGPEFLHHEAQLSKYRAQLDWMEQHALSPTESYALIQDIANQL